jgi:hypothetical protein
MRKNNVETIKRRLKKIKKILGGLEEVMTLDISRITTKRITITTSKDVISHSHLLTPSSTIMTPYILLIHYRTPTLT